MGSCRWFQHAATRCLFPVPCVRARYALVLVVRVLVSLALLVLVLAVFALLVLDLIVLALVALVVVCAVLAQHVLALVFCVLPLALAASLPLANRFRNVEARVLVFVGSRGRLVGWLG